MCHIEVVDSLALLNEMKRQPNVIVVLRQTLKQSRASFGQRQALSLRFGWHLNAYPLHISV